MEKHSELRVVLIAGPTASGKSEAAVAIAEQLGGIVVNADAMQVYRDLKIITARPDADEKAAVPHHLFGHVDAGERYSVGRWLDDVEPLLQAARQLAQPVIFAGGTGLYFKALCEGLSDIPNVPPKVEARWKRELKVQGPRALHAILMSLDAEVGAPR